MYNSQLKTFVAVCDSGSFNKAADGLFISSTAVIKQINTLEKHLELTLLSRSKQGVTLTPAGKVIYQRAKELFALSERAVAEARAAAEAESTTFCVGTSILNPCKPFMDLWYQVNRQFPGYKLHIVPFEDDHEGILSEIEALGVKFDFLIAACDSQQWLNRCNFLQIATYRLCCAVSREHPLAKKRRLTVADLYGQTLMMVQKGDSPSVDCVRSEIERHPQIKIEDTAPFYDIEVFNRCVQSQSVLMTLECWADVHPSLVTIPVDWDFAIPYGILYPLNPTEDAVELLHLIEAVCRKAPI